MTAKAPSSSMKRFITSEPPRVLNCHCTTVELTKWQRRWLTAKSVRVSCGLSRSNHRPLWPDFRMVRTRGFLADDALVGLWLFFGLQVSWTRF